MRGFRSRVLAAAAVGVVLLASWVGVPKAEAEPISIREIAARQEQIRPAKIAILDQSRDWDGYGFAGMRTDPQNQTIYVRWVGQAPAAIREVLKGYETGGVRVRVEQVAFTEAELATEARRLVESGAARVAGPAKDLSGLSVVPAAGARAVPTSRYPVTVLPDSSFPEPTGRLNDAGAWHGGARARHGSTGYCTLGFGYRDANGVYTSTANHCAYGNNVPWRDWAGDPIGLSQRSRYEDDATLIKVGSVGASAYLLSGPWDSTVRPFRPVRGEAPQPMQGDVLCQSGAVSGEICGLRIGLTSFVWAWRLNEPTGGLVAEQLDPNVHAVAKGDSGGPVYEMLHTSPDIWAVGMASGGIETMPCGGGGTQPGAICLGQIWVTYVHNIIEARGLSLVTV